MGRGLESLVGLAWQKQAIKNMLHHSTCSGGRIYTLFSDTALGVCNYNQLMSKGEAAIQSEGKAFNAIMSGISAALHMEIKSFLELCMKTS